MLQYNRHVIRNLNYDMFTDLEPVTLLFFLTQGLAVSSKLNVATLDQLAAYSKAHPGTLSYTAAAIPHQAFMESWKERSGADIVRVHALHFERKHRGLVLRGADHAHPGYRRHLRGCVGEQGTGWRIDLR